MAEPGVTRWLLPLPAARPRLRLLCLPSAGSGAQLFQGLHRYAPPWLQLCPVHLPGRDTRIDEPAATHLADLVPQIADAVVALHRAVPLPLAVFGHSMGGLLGYELSAHLAGLDLSPTQLIASATVVPTEEGRAVLARGIADPVAFLRRTGGTPAEVWAYPELLDLIVDTLVADLRMLARHRAGDHQLGCPVSLLYGRGDELAGPLDVAWWRPRTRAGLTVRVFPGGHFYLQDDPGAIVSALCGFLEPTVSPVLR